MIVSEIFELNYNLNLTKEYIENFFDNSNIKPIKWAIVNICGEKIKILASFEKKTL